ncbi:MAG: DUF1844 domain-containing protein [Bradymonadales bacterium]|nr:MAG: DUF1844 domain-containing protein [Bradymonadales bacterium]
MFVISVGSAALMSLGELEDPITKKKDIDLTSAKQNISILELLVEKTKGNLSESEEKLLQGVIYEARLKFVEKTGKSET